jgi:thiol-disulfide isomerase/thioredoxin
MRGRVESPRVNAARSLTQVTGRVLQRACSCAATGEAECEECKTRQLAVQRSSTSGRTAVPPVVHDVLREHGQSLDVRARASMEQSLGHDFSAVRVHTDRRANESARAVNALAYTSGRDIVFAAGHYAPGTRAGDRLIAHELTHVGQQSKAGAAPLSGIDADPRAEREANAVADQTIASHGVPGGVRESASRSLQRQPAPGKTSEAFEDAPVADTSGCVQEFQGASVEAELRPNTVTVFEFGATWCNPCKTLAGFMAAECTKHKSDKKPMRFFSVDIDKNAGLNDRWAHGQVPQLYVFDGTTQVFHGTQTEPMEVYSKLFDGLMTTKAAAETEEKKKKDEEGTTGIPRLGLAGIFGAGAALTALGAFGLAATFGGKAEAGVVAGVVGGAFAAGAVFGLVDPFGMSKRTKPVGAAEADALIRQRFGNDIPKAGTSDAPLHNATIHAVTQAELKAFWKCRHPKEEPPKTIVGWTDQGPEDPKAEQEPVCASGQKLERASFDKPVIYFAKDQADGSVLIHEGLHAYEHPDFSLKLRNVASEGTTEYFAQQIGSDIRMSSSSAYSGNEVKEVQKLVDVIGEDALRQAFFHGNFGPADNVLGKCGLEEWAQNLQMRGSGAADDVLKKQKKDYCTP